VTPGPPPGRRAFPLVRQRFPDKPICAAQIRWPKYRHCRVCAQANGRSWLALAARDQAAPTQCATEAGGLVIRQRHIRLSRPAHHLMNPRPEEGSAPKRSAGPASSPLPWKQGPFGLDVVVAALDVGEEGSELCLANDVRPAGGPR
jgi:hypothetical protein